MLKKQDAHSFQELIMGVASVYGRKVDKVVLEVYWRAFEKYEFEAISQSYSAHLVDTDVGQYWPKPADIIRHIDGNKLSRALQAWSKVDKAIRSVGIYESVIFDDSVIHAVIEDMGGWIALCNVSGDEFKFKGNEFEKRYFAKASQQNFRFPARLIGESEAYNSQNGHPVQKPTLIGDVQCAIAVYRKGLTGSESGTQITHYLPKPLKEIGLNHGN